MRFGRVPKREKARILAAMQQSSHSRSQEKAVAAELEDEQRLLTTVVQAHLDTCDFTRDKVAPILVRARETPNYTACPPTLVSNQFSNVFSLCHCSRGNFISVPPFVAARTFLSSNLFQRCVYFK